MLKAEKEQLMATVAELKEKFTELEAKYQEKEAETDTFLRKLADHPATALILGSVAGALLGGFLVFSFIIC